ncbi:MAG: thioesterase family protein [Rhodocyclaceae bacterium]|nr:thioesterase family protein [Rhodocyclaceae bacterium]
MYPIPKSPIPAADRLRSLPGYRTEVLPAWIDPNQHMGVAYYHVIMNEAGWHAAGYWDFGLDYRLRTQQTTFILEMHARYLRELNLGDSILATVRMLGLDDKRMHLWYEIFNEREGYLAATGEGLIISVDANTRRVVPFAPELHRRLTAACEAHRALPEAPTGPFLIRIGANGLERATLD